MAVTGHQPSVDATGLVAPEALHPLPARQQRRAERRTPGANKQRQTPAVGLRQEQIELHARVYGQGELIVAAPGVVPLGEAVGVAGVQVLPEQIGRAGAEEAGRRLATLMKRHVDW